MAGLKAIRRRIKSVHNTKKITYAMKLVSAAKLRKAQEAVTKSREYTKALREIVSELAASLGSSDFAHPLMVTRQEVKQIRLLVLGGSRGLCGGFNANLNRQVEVAVKVIEAKHPGASITSTIIGRKPVEYYRKMGRPVVHGYEVVSDDPNQWPLEEVCFGIEQAFLKEEIDEVYVVYTQFRSAISSKAVLERLLPMDSSLVAVENVDPSTTGVIFEPSPEVVFSAVVPRILRSIIRQASLETKASEHGSRMAAMDSATKNAGELATKLKLQLNKLRQGGITGELLDIIGGVNAIS